VWTLRPPEGEPVSDRRRGAAGATAAEIARLITGAKGRIAIGNHSCARDIAVLVHHAQGERVGELATLNIGSVELSQAASSSRPTPRSSAC
jgi:hypothetical protein